VALGGIARKTKKVKMAQNIVHMRRLGPKRFSSKPFKKEMKKVERIAEQDAWVNEFMSYSRPSPVGGEYVMPLDNVRSALENIYGKDPTLQTLSFEDEDEEDRMTRKEFRSLNRMRRKGDPSKVGGARPRRSQFNMGNMPGISKYIGSLPNQALGSEPGQFGARGGSQSDQFQDVWVSGASISYSFDEEDQKLL